MGTDHSANESDTQFTAGLIMVGGGSTPLMIPVVVDRRTASIDVPRDLLQGDTHTEEVRELIREWPIVKPMRVWSPAYAPADLAELTPAFREIREFFVGYVVIGGYVTPDELFEELRSRGLSDRIASRAFVDLVLRGALVLKAIGPLINIEGKPHRIAPIHGPISEHKGPVTFVGSPQALEAVKARMREIYERENIRTWPIVLAPSPSPAAGAEAADEKEPLTIVFPFHVFWRKELLDAACNEPTGETETQGDDAPPPLSEPAGVTGTPAVPAAPVVATQDADTPDLITLDQAAALVGKTKAALEKYKTTPGPSKLPPPYVKGRKGQADEWDYPNVMKPWLEANFNRKLPARPPSLRNR